MLKKTKDIVARIIKWFMFMPNNDVNINEKLKIKLLYKIANLNMMMK